MKGTSLLLLFGVGLLVAVLVTGIYVVPRAQAGSPATARQSDAARVPISDVYLDVTYATPEFVGRVKLEPYLNHYRERTQPFLIGVNTHVGSIAHLDFRGKVLLEDSRGDRFPALGAPVVLSEHHNMYLLVFPRLDNYGQPIFAASRGHFRLLVNGVGNTSQRVFQWKLPVVEPTPARTLANTLVLALGVIGALMVILSPCAIELTTYYTGIIAGIVSSAAQAGGSAKAMPNLRPRILRNLGAFVAGFTTLYVTSGASVALLGHSLMNADGPVARQIKPIVDAICSPTGQWRNPTSLTAAAATGPEHHAGHAGLFGEWGHYANWLGAAFLVYFALRSLGLFKRGGACFVWLAKLGWKLRAGLATVVALVSPQQAAVIRRPALSLRDSANITPLNSFCAGLGLSVSCLTCMGGAILYPLLIFVGTSTWYWGALILGTYSLALAVPMAAIAVAVGDFAWKYADHRRLIRGLRWTSAVVMIFVAVLVAFDRTRFINTVVFTLLSAIGGNPSETLASL
ncbi:MAG: hypothetical protein KGS61_00410 [Verrucomicrobia bacterium]|nr:hypothetical protein [Verrucomicrobiota bacterium]